MEFQAIIVGLVVLISLLFIGRYLILKAKSFSSKSNCEVDCGCSTKAKEQF